MTLTATMTGSGSVGGILPGWSITEQCTPAMFGDTRGSVGHATFTAHANADSRFVADNQVVLTTSGGAFRGRASEVSLLGGKVDVTVAGAHQFLNSEHTVPPVWLDQTIDLAFAYYGGSSGQIGRSQGVAVDPVDGGFLVTSQDTVNGNDRYKVIKFDSDGNYVTEFGSLGSGNGQFGSLGATVTVSPVDQSVWIGDLFNRRLLKFTTADGGLTYAWSLTAGSPGSGNGQFGSSNAYISVACDSSGNVYASDRGNDRIQKFNSSGTYQAQVAVTHAEADVYSITVDSSDQLLTGLLSNTSTVGEVRIYDSSLALVSTVALDVPANTSRGIVSIAADPNGGTWVVWNGASFVIHYDADWVETFRWYGESLSFIAAGADAVVAYLLSYRDISLRRVVAFHFEPVTLSQAIERYMEACSPTLNGWTLDYQAADNPAVVFPGWSGNVWANLKELFAAYGVELVQDASTQTLIIRDIASATTVLNNMGPPQTVPQNLTGGRIVDVYYQQPRAGGGIVWDATRENVRLSIGAGDRQTRILATVNHPAELVAIAPTDSLPMQPGRYYVVDSTGAHVDVDVWQAAGGQVTAKVGETPGTISVTMQGPSGEIAGFAGPYSFATGTGPSDTPALSVVGNGTFCTPARFRRAESQGSPFVSPFIDTLDRALSRGHYPSLRSPNVVIQLTAPSADLPPMGQAVGTLFPFEQSVYRITEVRWGNLKSQVTAERYVTLQNLDDTWAGSDIEDFDTFWAGYSLGDIQIQPLRT